ncbi:hypothetical protein NYD60_06845 [Burkholderia thailandensis]|uniref:hypothetical protein n=1 Tax=Burkholderia thailandensis TaxID=57975 RepID=UPI0003EC6DEF|nr:hypothetical protein [Burkholderia thailandensis]AHI74991.1 hypothetical protein BTQ_4706 [Burkholderia thailandensis 2002721723]AIP29183.1 hypothetical protein DR63_4358 [Burkholderia thailandensis E264]AJY02990.1 hypothetical protein BG87_4163 [Burkholderia thailandensis 2002721643]MCS6499723.1 hypothetical protein [Burkholderia thailandensis]MCS6507340.1 hypothetical protein [Burkholderia thailandensis]
MEADDSSRLPLAGAMPFGARNARVMSAAPASAPTPLFTQPNARDAKRRETLVRR